MGVGCGLPPCFEGKLEIEILELNEEASSCHFDGWPQGTELLIESTGNRENLGDMCRRQGARYVARPEGQLGRMITGAELNGQWPYSRYYDVALIEPFEFEEQGCLLSVSGELLFSRLYDDFEHALRGQARGDEDAIVLSIGYTGATEGCAHLFPESSGSGNRVKCDNTHRVRVSSRLR